MELLLFVYSTNIYIFSELEKMGYPFYGNHQSNLSSTAAAAQGHMASHPGSFPAQGMNAFAYYQLMQQQRLLAMSMEKDEFARFPSPLCRLTVKLLFEIFNIIHRHLLNQVTFNGS